MRRHLRNVAASSSALLVLLATTKCGAHEIPPGRRVHYGLVGYGITMYEPPCAFACKGVLSECRLNCSAPSNDGSEFETSADCFASNDAFLQSLAWCTNSHCEGEKGWNIERFWEVDAVGEGMEQPEPKYGYRVALSMIVGEPGEILGRNVSLGVVGAVIEEEWKEVYSSMRTMAWVETQHSKYGIILLLTSVFLPLCAAFFTFLASFTSFERPTVSYLTYPALWGKRHARPLPFDIGLLPTRGQAIFILILILLNTILSIAGYRISSPDILTPNFHDRTEYIANRVGVLSFANIPAIILYSSRNNPLISLTGWSYSTFLLYHRWVAYICVFQATVHSIIWFVMHIDVLPHKFSQAYWNVGTMATIVFLLMVPFSVLFIRRRYYELFLNIHVFLAILGVGGCYYHIQLNFEHAWGYENWIFLAVLLWVMEKGARGVKMLKNGLKTAIITTIDEEYIRVDIPGVQATGQAYLYFPTLGWRFWENHPFSIASSVYESTELALEGKDDPNHPVFELVGSDSDSDDELDGAEGHRLDDLKRNENHSKSSVSETPQTPHSGVCLLPHDSAGGRDPLGSSHEDNDIFAAYENSTSGPSFYIRRVKGLTARLGMDGNSQLPVMLETSYNSLSISVFSTYRHLVCIIGGTGITTVMPILRARASADVGRTVLYWGCRSPALVREVGVERLSRAGVEVQVRTRERWNVEELVKREARSGGAVVVVVSGPSSMADDVRYAIVQANRNRGKEGRKGVIRLVEECFSW